MQRKHWLAAVVVALLAGLLVPSPAYLVAWLIWPDGVHEGAGRSGEFARLLVIYGGGVVFWASIAVWYLKSRRGLHP